MNYYLLMQDDRIPELPSILSCPDNINPMEWVEGKEMADPGPLHFVLPRGTEKGRGCIISGIVTLFHEILIAELNKLRIDNIQYFPIDLETPEDGRIEKTFSLINVIGLIDAVDKEASDIEYLKGLSRGLIKSFKIDPVKARGQRLFRIPEAPTLIVIDERLRDALDAYEFPGVMLLPTENYKNPSVV